MKLKAKEIQEMTKGLTKVAMMNAIEKNGGPTRYIMEKNRWKMGDIRREYVQMGLAQKAQEEETMNTQETKKEENNMKAQEQEKNTRTQEQEQNTKQAQQEEHIDLVIDTIDRAHAEADVYPNLGDWIKVKLGGKTVLEARFGKNDLRVQAAEDVAKEAHAAYKLVTSFSKPATIFLPYDEEGMTQLEALIEAAGVIAAAKAAEKAAKKEAAKAAKAAERAAKKAAKAAAKQAAEKEEAAADTVK